MKNIFWVSITSNVIVTTENITVRGPKHQDFFKYIFLSQINSDSSASVYLHALHRSFSSGLQRSASLTTPVSHSRRSPNEPLLRDNTMMFSKSFYPFPMLQFFSYLFEG